MLLGGEEGLKDPLARLGVHSNAGVSNGEHRVAPCIEIVRETAGELAAVSNF
jgi:hypothetical protein